MLSHAFSLGLTPMEWNLCIEQRGHLISILQFDKPIRHNWRLKFVDACSAAEYIYITNI